MTTNFQPGPPRGGFRRKAVNAAVESKRDSRKDGTNTKQPMDKKIIYIHAAEPLLKPGEIVKTLANKKDVPEIVAVSALLDEHVALATGKAVHPEIAGDAGKLAHQAGQVYGLLNFLAELNDLLEQQEQSEP